MTLDVAGESRELVCMFSTRMTMDAHGNQRTVVLEEGFDHVGRREIVPDAIYVRSEWSSDYGVVPRDAADAVACTRAVEAYWADMWAYYRPERVNRLKEKLRYLQGRADEKIDEITMRTFDAMRWEGNCAIVSASLASYAKEDLADLSFQIARTAAALAAAEEGKD